MILELGSGSQPHPRGTVRHDRVKHDAYIDVAHDLEVFPWPWADASAEGIIAYDVMEHLHCDVVVWLDECWRILAPGGLLELRLPNWNGENTWRDPTHYRPFHKDSFDYWDPDRELHQTYGRFYWDSGRWWQVVESRDDGNEVWVTLRKRASE